MLVFWAAVGLAVVAWAILTFKLILEMTATWLDERDADE